MGWHIGGIFCECIECGRQFMGHNEAVLRDHMVRVHGLSLEEARIRSVESMNHNVTEEYFYIPGIG